MSELATVYLCLGSNLGNREDNLWRALTTLVEHVDLEKVSSLYETEPVGCKEQPLFLNLVCRIGTKMPPEALLRLAKEIESGMGRLASFVNAPRPIDIDILFYGNRIMETEELTIPHPRLHERAFVLIPLSEIAPDLVHPGLAKSVARLASEVEGRAGVWRYEGGFDVSTICGRAL